MKEFNVLKLTPNTVHDAVQNATAAAEQTAEKEEQPISSEDFKKAKALLEKMDAEKKKRSRKTYTEEEALALVAAARTSGRKGVHMPRINLALTPDNYYFIRTMARVSGISMIEFINKMLDEARENHKDVYEQALIFRHSFDIGKAEKEK